MACLNLAGVSPTTTLQYLNKKNHELTQII
jgi:hypothetical protein